MNRCKMCGSAVLEAKNRRLLESASSKICRDGIVALGYGITVDHISFEHEFSSGYVCRKCFVAIENYHALKCQLIDIETDLQSMQAVKLTTAIAITSAISSTVAVANNTPSEPSERTERDKTPYDC